MRSVIIVLSLVILAGCANNRIRFVKASGHQTVVENDERQHIKREKSESRVYQESFTQESSEPSDRIAFSERENSDAVSTLEATPRTDQTRPAPEDSVLISENEYKYILAKRAEKDARNAKRWFSVSLAMMIIPVLALFSVIPFIIGLVMLSKSNRSTYITPEGQTQARIANILKWIIAVILILAAITIGVAIVVFIL